MFFGSPLTKVQMAKLGFDTTLTTGVATRSTGGIPSEFSLDQNYPNPFNPSTTISFSIAEKGFVRLEVYDIIGRLVKTMMADEFDPGNYTVTWDGSDENGNTVTSGIYLYKLQSGSFTMTKKMLLLK